MEAGDFETTLLVFDGCVRHNLAQLIFESSDISENFPDNCHSALATRPRVRVHRQIALVSPLNIEGEAFKGSKRLVKRDKDGLGGKWSVFNLAGLHLSLSDRLKCLNFRSNALNWPVMQFERQRSRLLHHCIVFELGIRVEVLMLELWLTDNHLVHVGLGD